MSATEFVAASDGTRLLRRSWPEPADPRAAILVVHGLGDHSGRFEHVGDHLSGHGFVVRAVDQRGHGGSEGRRGHLEDWDRVLDDLAPEISSLRGLGLPVVLYAHSLGGIVALTYVESGRPAPDLLILSAPALGSSVPATTRIAARVMGRVVPRLTLKSSVRGDHLSHDPAVGAAYFADPLVLTRLTTRFGSESLQAIARAAEGLDRLDVPTLVVHGGDDTLVPTSASEILAGVPGVERVVLEGLRHETHNEDGGIQVLTVVCDWLDRRLGELDAQPGE